MVARLVGVVVALALIAGVAWYALSGDGDGSPVAGAAPGGGEARGGGGGGRGGGRGGPPRRTLVVVEPVALARLDDRLEAIGDGEALASVTVVPRESGTLTGVPVVSGQRVAAGDPIATLDGEAEEIARDIAAREVEDATVARDRAARLVRSRAGARTDLDAAENALARAELALRDAQLMLDRRTVRAPIDGTVGLVELERGDRVTAETPIATIDDRTTIRVDFRVPERFAGRVRAGQRIEAGSFALPGTELSGEIVAVGGRVERDSRTLPVQAAIDNAGDRLRPGMSFSVTLRFDGEDLPAVDPLAVQWDSTGSFVWKVVTGNDGASSATRVPVRIVQRNPESVLVGAELAPGDPVVVEGLLSVREGAPVRVQGAPAAGGGGSRRRPSRLGRRRCGVRTDRRRGHLMAAHSADAAPARAAAFPSADTGGVTALFVRRPILAIVLNLLIVVAGLAAILGAEVRELPSVDSPIITVSTDYDGAAPETIDREITSNIERAAGRVPGVASISSSSSFGRSRVTVEFSTATDLDVAASDMRDAIGRIARELPDTADDPRIVKADADGDAVMRLAVTSDERSAEELTVLVENRVIDRLTAIDGVADLQVYGDREQVFRVDVDPARLASRGLDVADLSDALSSAAFDTPAGSLTSPTRDLSVRATANVADARAFEALQIDEYTRVGDVATVTLGADVGTSSLRANGRTGIGIGIVRQAGSSTLAISTDVRRTVDELAALLPGDVDVRVTSDDATFISGSIREVLKSLVIAIGIVVAVIFVFLLDWRATLVPAITLPVALVGTVAGIWLAGFSINILTLLALVLATGLVVDDAIVVLENVVRRRSDGLGARAAAVLGTREVFFAVIATTATLAAVFVPLSFLPGKAGGLFREFGFTLAIAVLLSSTVALTLCPMLASRLLGDATGGARRARRPAALRAVAGVGDRLAALYGRTVTWCIRFAWIVLAVVAGFAGLAWVAFGALDEELLPREDRSVALMRVSGPQGVSLEWTAAQLRKIEDLAEPFVERGEVRNVFSIAGTRGQRPTAASSC